jgi:hypothetical protein
LKKDNVIESEHLFFLGDYVAEPTKDGILEEGKEDERSVPQGTLL